MLGIQIHLQIGFIIQFLSSRCIKRVLKTVCIYCIFTDLQLPFAKGARASMPLPSWSADQMIPADIRGGSGMAPAAPYRHQTGAMRSSSPGFRTVRAKMAAVPTAVPTTAVPGVIGTPCWSLKCRLYQR